MVKGKVKCWRCGKELRHENFSYCEKCKDKEVSSGFFSTFILGMFLTIIICLGVALLTGLFDSSIDRLKINKNNLVSDYVKEYYPEFKNCTIEYNLDDDANYANSIEQANIYCEKLTSRDSLEYLKDEPDYILVFKDDLDINKLFKLRLDKEGLR